MKRIDWSRYAPLGIDGAAAMRRVFSMPAVSAIISLHFFFRLTEALDELYLNTGSARVLVPTRQMAPFVEVLGGSLLMFLFSALMMIVVGVYFYLYHYQGSRSIYTMRRLPNRWELWRRVLTLPGLTVLLCAVSALLLVVLYFAIYTWVTPAPCLQPGQWQTIWEG